MDLTAITDEFESESVRSFYPKWIKKSERENEIQNGVCCELALVDVPKYIIIKWFIFSDWKTRLKSQFKLFQYYEFKQREWMTVLYIPVICTSNGKIQIKRFVPMILKS